MKMPVKTYSETEEKNEKKKVYPRELQKLQKK